MWTKEDTTYNDIRRISLDRWLEEMEVHEDIAVRGGVRLTREYIEHLEKEIRRLQLSNEMTKEYLAKLMREGMGK